MHTSVTLDDEVFQELMKITQETNHIRAVQKAVEGFVRAAKLERLRQLQGEVSILSNEELEVEEIRELESQGG